MFFTVCVCSGRRAENSSVEDVCLVRFGGVRETCVFASRREMCGDVHFCRSAGGCHARRLELDLEELRGVVVGRAVGVRLELG